MARVLKGHRVGHDRSEEVWFMGRLVCWHRGGDEKWNSEGNEQKSLKEE